MKKVGLTASAKDDVSAYIAALASVGIEAIVILPNSNCIFTGLHGLVLSAGADINPILYGQSKGPDTKESDDARDEMEIRLVRRAVELDMPVLGICRGCQILNVAFGGTLIQHLATAERHQIRTTDKSSATHSVITTPESQIDRIIRATARVNSRHHQGIDKVAGRLTVSARCVNDRVIEAVEMANQKFVIGVQWHPEDQVGRYDHATRLFRTFASLL